MKKHTLASMLAIALVGVLLFAVIFFFRNRPTEVHEPAVAHEGAGGTPFAHDTPTKENVNQEYKQQVEQLKLSVQKHPDNVFHLTMLATLLMEGHQAGDAVRYFERAARLQPQNDSVLLDLSVCYSLLKKYDAALHTTDQLLHNNPGNLTALYNKGALLATMGKNAEAVRCWKQLIDRAPSSDEAKKAGAGIAVIGG